MFSIEQSGDFFFDFSEENLNLSQNDETSTLALVLSIVGVVGLILFVFLCTFSDKPPVKRVPEPRPLIRSESSKNGTISSLLVRNQISKENIKKNSSFNLIHGTDSNPLGFLQSNNTLEKSFKLNSFLVSAGSQRPFPPSAHLPMGFDNLMELSQRRGDFLSDMSQDEKERIEQIKNLKLSVGTQSFIKIDSIFPNPDIEAGKELSSAEVEPAKFVDKVCETLNKEIRSVEQVDVVDPKSSSFTSTVKQKFKQFVRTKQPKISISAYILRLVVAVNTWFSERKGKHLTGVRCLIMSLVYLRKMKINEKYFELNVFNIHRIFSSLILISAKFSEDIDIPMSYWSEVSGVPVDVLSDLEKELCFSADFDFSIEFKEVVLIFEEYQLDDFAGEVLDEWKKRELAIEAEQTL